MLTMPNISLAKVGSGEIDQDAATLSLIKRKVGSTENSYPQKFNQGIHAKSLKPLPFGHLNIHFN